jgi:hypothetical protein
MCIKMVDGKMSFRERNRARLAKKGVVSVVNKKVMSGADVYEIEKRSKVGDFFIGFGIFFLGGIFSLIGIIIALVIVSIYYNDWFGKRRFVKYGMISYFVIVVVMMVLGFVYLSRYLF